MKSIRFKLFGVFIIILIIFQMVSLFSSMYFLDEIFLEENKKTLIKIYSEFSDTNKLKQNPYSIYEAAHGIGGKISIVKKDTGVIMSTSTDNCDETFDCMPSYISKNIEKVDSESIPYSIYYSKENNDSSNNKIVFVGKLADGNYFVIEKSLVLVYESSRVSTKFIMVSGGISLIIGSIVVFFLSRKLTNPIININNVAQEIAKQNFNEKVKEMTNDEIGVLGKSINLISSKLSEALEELKEKNIKLTHDIERERSLEKMRRRFVSSVSHELRTPISMIQAYADGLKFNIAKKPEDMEFYCDVIIDESNKMDYLIKDLLDLSCYESGTFKINKKEFNLTDLMSEIGGKYIKAFESENIKLYTELEHNCIINGDDLRIEQIINNFVSNAKKYVSDNGYIKIELKKVGKKSYISVFNTGENIDETYIDDIWTSFYKIESTDGKINKGTGLGLAVIRAIVELHNGEYGVENLDNGVLFWVEI